jgi:hypothetical protein
LVIENEIELSACSAARSFRNGASQCRGIIQSVDSLESLARFRRKNRGSFSDRRGYLPTIRQQIEPTVRSWHFTPGKVDGRPEPTRTTLIVGVALEKSKG